MSHGSRTVPQEQGLPASDPHSRIDFSPALLQWLRAEADANASREIAGILGADPNNVVVFAQAVCQGLKNEVRVPAAHWLRAAAELESRALTWCGTYHSHTESVAYPSRADRKAIRGDQVMVILSVKYRELRAFRRERDGFGVRELHVRAAPSEPPS